MGGLPIKSQEIRSQEKKSWRKKIRWKEKPRIVNHAFSLVRGLFCIKLWSPPGRISDRVIVYSGCTTRSLKFQMPPLLLISRWGYLTNTSNSNLACALNSNGSIIPCNAFTWRGKHWMFLLEKQHRCCTETKWWSKDTWIFSMIILRPFWASS